MQRLGVDEASGPCLYAHWPPGGLCLNQLSVRPISIIRIRFKGSRTGIRTTIHMLFPSGR